MAGVLAWLGPTAAIGEPWTVMAHLDGRKGLGPAAERYVKQLASSRKHLAGLAIQTVRDGRGPEGATLRRWVVGAGGERRCAENAPLTGTSDQDPLSTFLNWSRGRLPGNRVGLLVMGHGVGLAECEGRPGSLGIVDLRRDIEPVVQRWPRPLSLLALDTCFGASLETAYEMRGLTRYLTAAPGLIHSPGLDWAAAVAEAAGEKPDEALARALVGRGMKAPAGSRVALVALDLGQVETVAEALGALAKELRGDLEGMAPVVGVVRSRCMTWGSRGELCDLGQLATGLAANATSPGVGGAAEKLATSIEALAIARWAAGEETDLVRPWTGLGVYFPATLERLPEGYALSLELGARTGWRDFLSEYWGRAEGLLVGPQP